MNARAAASVMNFLRQLYWSIGETLPHESLVLFSSLAVLCGGIIFPSCFPRLWLYNVTRLYFQSISNFPDFKICELPISKIHHQRMKFDPRSPLSTQDGRTKLVDVLLETSMGGSTRMTQAGPENLPRRYLPPGKYSDLFRLYTAQCLTHGRAAASSTTFFRVLRESGWRCVLRFRGSSTHAECAVCHALKARMRSCRDLQRHAVACDKYMRHLAGTFADRQCYWQFRERSAVNGDLLTLIVDGMDKSKFLLPRYSFGVTPKALETRQRPACELSAVLAHGWGVFVYVTDSEQSTGTDWACEIVSRTLDKCWKISQCSKRAWPSILKVFADNTPKVPFVVHSKVFFSFFIESYGIHLAFFFQYLLFSLLFCCSDLLCFWVSIPGV